MLANTPIRAALAAALLAVLWLPLNSALAASKHKKSSKSASTSEQKNTAKSGKKVSSKTSTHRSHRKKRAKSSRKRGQAAIDAERAQQIQEALIREHYLDGKPSGNWDAATQAAMRRYQADNGWQNKTVPDSRALIKLGLGPNHDHLLNPETAMTTGPQAEVKPAAVHTGADTPSAPASAADPASPPQQ